MRNIYTIVFSSFLIFFPTITAAQVWFTNGQKWIYNFSDWSVVGNEELTVDRDTSLAGVMAKVIRIRRVAKDFLDEDPTYETSFYGNRIVYEQDGIVYSWHEGAFRIIYNFNLGVGDHLPHYSDYNCPPNHGFTIIRTDTVEINGIDRRTQIVRQDSFDPPDFIPDQGYLLIEGLGMVEGGTIDTTTSQISLSTPLPSGYFFPSQFFYCATTDVPSYGFRCFSDEDFTYPAPESCDNLPFTTTTYTPIEEKLKIFPNPFTDEIWVETDPSVSISSIKMLDINGKLVAEVIEARKLHVKGLLPGIYILRVDFSKGYSLRRKVVKHR